MTSARLWGKIMKAILCAGVLALALAACSRDPVAPVAAVEEAPHVVAASAIDAGRYLIVQGGCNDCHTPNYPETGGNVPEADWLVGNIPYYGPWGTSYPSNLRLYVQTMDEKAWIQMMKTRNGLPPMPWNNIHQMSEADLGAMYKFIKSLGPKGVARPGALPPGQAPKEPYYYYVPLTGKPPA